MGLCEMSEGILSTSSLPLSRRFRFTKGKTSIRLSCGIFFTENDETFVRRLEGKISEIYEPITCELAFF